jgi:hypothetical protein
MTADPYARLDAVYHGPAILAFGVPRLSRTADR